MKKLIGSLSGFSFLFYVAESSAQVSQETIIEKADVQCAADDYACHILRMKRKPGSGGSGISTDKEIEALFRKNDVNELGVTRIPSEEIQLPRQQMNLE